MFILSKDGKNLVNCNRIETLSIVKEYIQYGSPDMWWEIRAILPGGSYVVIDRYYTKQECQNVFVKLSQKITDNIIDVADLWDD